MTKEPLMRRSEQIDQLLENAVAEALGLEKPHPMVRRKMARARAPKAIRRHGATLPLRHDSHRVAA